MPDSAIAAVAELAAHSHSVITRSQAADHLTTKRIATAVRQGWLTEPYPGVLCVAGAVDSFEHRLLAATLALGGCGVASHRSAARLHMLDGCLGIDEIEVSVSRAHRWQFESRVRVHHVTPLEPRDVVIIDGIRATSMARTLCDLGSVDHPDRVAQALSDARRRGASLANIRATCARTHRPGQSGTAVLARLLDAITFEAGVPESWFEELLARCLEHPRIPALVPQHVISSSSGGFVARVDLAIPALRLGIEAHSRKFHFGADAQAADEQRDLRVAACGWDLLYLGWHATQTPEVVTAIVADIVDARRRAL